MVSLGQNLGWVVRLALNGHLDRTLGTTALLLDRGCRGLLRLLRFFGCRGEFHFFPFGKMGLMDSSPFCFFGGWGVPTIITARPTPSPPMQTRPKPRVFPILLNTMAIMLS